MIRVGADVRGGASGDSLGEVRPVIEAVSPRWHQGVGAVATVLVVALVTTAIAGASANGRVKVRSESGSGAARVQPSRANSSGVVLTGFGRARDDEAFGVAVQRDGKIVVAGVDQRAGSIQGSDVHIAVARYEPDGRLDTGFGVNGKVLVSGDGAGVAAVAVLPDGKIVAGGSTLVRLLPDGRLDAGFGLRGTLETDPAWTFAIQRDGKLVAAGEAHSRFTVARYSADGRLDRGFGLNGRASADFDSGYDPDACDYVNAVSIQSDQKIVAIGTVNDDGAGQAAQFGLARYTVTGLLDPSFGTGGTVRTEIGGESYANTGAIQADGKIIAAGYRGDGAGIALARYLPNGRLDATFGVRGQVRGRTGGVSALAIQRDGKILVARGAVMFRYSSRGSLEPSFGARTTLSSFVNVHAIALQGNAKILVAGRSDKGDFALARLTADGRLDPTFGR